MRVRVYWPLDVWVYVGPWGARIVWPSDDGRFLNGSRWWSGWSRWREEP